MRMRSDDLLLGSVDTAGTGADLGGPSAGMPLTAQGFDPVAYPYDMVVRITDEIGGLRYQASGVLIAPDEVLTASHVVYQAGVGTATNIDMAPGYNNGVAPYGHAAGTLTHYTQIPDNPYIYTDDSQTDYAIIHLSTPFPGLGGMGLQPNFSGGPVHVTGYPGSGGGSMIDSTQSVSVDSSYTLLDGTSIGPGSSGGPVWTYGADGLPRVVGLVSAEGLSASATGQTAGTNVQITAAALDQIASWESQDHGVSWPTVQVYGATLGQWVADALTRFYTGPVVGIRDQYIDVTSHSVNITAKSPNYFIHTGSGNDAITLLGGTNTADGGAGSNFLTGGTGTDTFYVDDRGAASDIWSTVSNFHAGDSATVWGVSPTSAALNWADNQGAAGSTGLTLHATSAGRPTASLTLAGFSQADMASQRLTVQYGYDASSRSSYLYVHDNR